MREGEATLTDVERLRLPLAPGDRGILSVSPWVGGEAGSAWSCARCGRGFLTQDSWLVDYRHQGAQQYSFLVCRNCAEELSPVRLTVDLRALERVQDDEELEQVRELARTVAAQRAGEDSDELSLRWADVHRLADAAGTSPSRLARRLSDAGVLIRCEPAETAWDEQASTDASAASDTR